MAKTEANDYVPASNTIESFAPANAEKLEASENFQQEAQKLMKDYDSKPHPRPEIGLLERNPYEDKPQNPGDDALAFLEAFSISGTDEPKSKPSESAPKADHKDSKGADHHQDHNGSHEPSIGIPNWMLNFMN